MEVRNVKDFKAKNAEDFRMKKAWFFAVAVVGWVVLSSVSFGATYGGGSGTATDFYQIWTPQQMNDIGVNPSDWGACFKLMADIDMSIYTGTQYKIIGNSATQFTGTFDGNGYTIRNLTYKTTATVTYVGIFGYTNNASIKNLRIENANLSTKNSSYYGVITGYQSFGIIANCYCTSSVNTTSLTSSSYAGGLVGYSKSGIINNCTNVGSVTVSAYNYSPYTGGIVGCMVSGTIINSFSIGSVTASSPDRGYTGGLIGYFSGTITNCYSTNSVTSSPYSLDFFNMAGGLVGYQESGTIMKCYSTGSVTASSRYISCGGGLVGYQSSGTISNCYSTGSVNSSSQDTSFCYSHAGGLVGRQNAGTISNCFSIGSVTSSSASYSYSSSSRAGGLVGSQDSGIITNCYSMGSITCSPSSSSANYVFHVGGLVGFQGNNFGAKIEKCYCTGQVSATGNSFCKGGVLGYKDWDSGTIATCFWDINTTGINDGVGNVNPDPTGVIGKTTEEMKIVSVFTLASWDFANETANGTNDIWRMCVDGVDYPRLNWESIDGDFECPNGVNIEDLNYFVGRWMLNNCTSSNNYCGGVDMDVSGDVDLGDFSIFAQHWLEM